jgi:hypothetical protein
MVETKCTYNIAAFVDDKKITLECNPEICCLHELVWSGIGVRKAAIQELVRTGQATGKEDIRACTEGNCLNNKP